MLSQWVFGEGASAVSRGRLSWHNLVICWRLFAAMTAPHRPSWAWLCSFFLITLSPAVKRQLNISVKPHAVAWWVSAGFTSFPFLLELLFITLMTTCPYHQFPFLARPWYCERTNVLFSHTSPVYRKSESRIWSVCFSSFSLKIYFYLSRQTPSSQAFLV